MNETARQVVDAPDDSAAPLHLTPHGTAAADLARASRERATAGRLWFLAGNEGPQPWRIGIATACTIVLLNFAIMAGWHGVAALPTLLTIPSVTAPMVFFAISLGLLAGLAQVVFPAARQDLADLADGAEIDPAVLADFGKGLTRYPRSRLLAAIPIAAAAGSLHVWQLGTASFGSGVWVASAVCTLLLWSAMFQIAMPLLHNARLFSLLGQCTEVDVYRSDRLFAFGRTAIRPCLFLVALQCAYVVLLIPEGVSIGRGGAPLGLLASLALVAGLFFLPLQGIRRSIRAEREEALQALDRALAEQPAPQKAGFSNLVESASLLALRERIASVSTWPLGLEGIRRMFGYLVLVPLTWVGAALVEMAIDGWL